MSLLTINTLRKCRVCLSLCKLSLPCGQELPQHAWLQHPQCTKPANNQEVSWRWWNFVLSGFRQSRWPHIVGRFDTWIHGFTAAQWVRSDPEPAALQRRLFSKQCESCQRCILTWRRETDGGGAISAELLWQFTGKKVRCLISFRRTCRLVFESSKQYCGRSAR